MNVDIKKRYVKKMYIKWKQNKASRKKYIMERGQMKELIERKKEQLRERVWTEIGEVKSQIQIWKFINKEKRRKETGAQISIED